MQALRTGGTVVLFGIRGSVDEMEALRRGLEDNLDTLATLTLHPTAGEPEGSIVIRGIDNEDLWEDETAEFYRGWAHGFMARR